MTDSRTVKERVLNWLFAIPAVTQVWAKRAAERSTDVLDTGQGIPFAPLARPLSRCRVALITTGGLHVRTQLPFDMDNPDGDASYRVIPGDVDLASLTITHKYYDHRDADADPNIIFPLAHVRDLVSQGVLGDVAPRHFGFMGHIDHDVVEALKSRSAPTVAAMLRADQVDCVLLTPA